MKRLTIGVLTLLCLLLAACAGEVENSSAEESLAASEGVSSVQSFDASSDEEFLVSIEESSELSEEPEPAESSELSEEPESAESSDEPEGPVDPADKNYENTLVAGENGNYSCEVPYGYTWHVNYVDGKICGEDVTICTTDDAYKACNPNWAITILLQKLEDGTYVAVQDAVVTPGNASKVTVGENQIALVVHSTSSNPDAGYANWLGKVVAVSVKAGDIFEVAEDWSSFKATNPATVEDSPEDPIEPAGKPTTGEEWENLFFERCGFHPDFFQILNTASYQKLAEVWMDNPIDQWGYAYAQLAMTTGDMVALEETVTANWLREIEESIAYIKKWYPEYGASLEEEHIIWKEAVQLRADLPLDLMRYADNFGTLQLVYHAGDISALYRERAFQLLYEEFHCKESVDDKSHEIGLEMIVPEGMEVELEEGRFSGGFGDFYWACETESFEEDYVLDNPIDAWEREFLVDYDIFLSDIDLGDVMIANWKREIEEATALILDCYPEMEELLAREAIAWKQGIFGHSPLSLVLDTGYYGTLHLMLDEDVAVYQYRHHALHLLHLAVACVELQEYTGRTTDLVPELTFVMPEL